MTNGLVNGRIPPADTRSIIRLSLRDSLREYGPISDMVFIMSRIGVSHPFTQDLSLVTKASSMKDRHVPVLVTCTGSSHLGGFTLFQARVLSPQIVKHASVNFNPSGTFQRE